MSDYRTYRIRYQPANKKLPELPFTLGGYQKELEPILRDLAGVVNGSKTKASLEVTLEVVEEVAIT